MPEEAPDSQLAERELEERRQRQLNTAVHAGAAAQIIIAAAVILAICYVAKLVLITLLVSILLAFMLEPMVNLLEKIPLAPVSGRIPGRPAHACCHVCGELLSLWQSHELCPRIPKYSDGFAGICPTFRQQTSELEKTTQQVLPRKDKKTAKSHCQ